MFARFEINTPTDDFVKTGSEIFGFNDDFNGKSRGYWLL